MISETLDFFKTQNEKLNSHIKGLSAQAKAFSDTLADAHNSINVLRTNLILTADAHKDAQKELADCRAEITRLQDTIAALNAPKSNEPEDSTPA